MSVESFKSHIIDAGVLDPEGTHHEFVSGMHGRKLDFDIIESDTLLYSEWIDVTTSFVEEQFPDLPEVILGVANGTNRVALDVARKFNGKVFGAVSEKNPQNSKELYLSDATGKLISALKPDLVVVIEDVGTTGSNSVQVARHALASGAQEVKVVTTWKRRPNLERLQESGIPYMAIIDEPLTTYEADECRSSGYCEQNWQFIPRV